MRAAVQVEARVLPLLAHRPHVAHAGAGDQQPHARVAHPERGQPAELLGEVEAEVGAADHRVDPLGPRQVLRAEHLGGVGGEGRAEGVEALRLAAPARPRPGARRTRSGAPRRPRGRRAGRSRGCCGPSRALPLAVERDHDRRPVMALDQPRGDDPDHARDASPRRRRRAPAPRAARPAAPGGRSRRPRRPRARSPAARRWRDSARSAISAARPGSSVRNSSTPASARYSRPAALIRGASRKARSPSSSRVGSHFAASTSARIPGRSQRRTCSSPRRTSDRFSPTSGTTSATVASATRSRSRRPASGAGSPELLAMRAWGPRPDASAARRPASRRPPSRRAP